MLAEAAVSSVESLSRLLDQGAPRPRTGWFELVDAGCDAAAVDPRSQPIVIRVSQRSETLFARSRSSRERSGADMLRPIGRRLVLKTSVAFAAGLLLRPAVGCEFWTSSLRITHPWTRATEAEQTTAIVSLKFDEVMQSDRLIGVETPVAGGARLGGRPDTDKIDFPIAAGRDYEFSAAETHIVLIDLQQPLQMARTYPLYLRFERAGLVKTDLTVDFAGKRFG